MRQTFAAIGIIHAGNVAPHDTVHSQQYFRLLKRIMKHL
jgi:hypothetical protein